MRKDSKTLKRWHENTIDTLGTLYEYSTTKFSDNKQSQVIDEELFYTYGSLKEKCESISNKLSKYGIVAGDKVAILSHNTPNWTVVFFACVSSSRIVVPILPYSSEHEVTNILLHSESKVIFISRPLLYKLSQESLSGINLIVDIDTFETINADDGAFTSDGIVAVPKPDDIAVIIYTSGTTGNPKAVLMSHRNLTANLKSCYHTYKCTKKDKWLSILPMSHSYELTLGVIYPFYCGSTVYYLSKPPVPTLILEAMKKIRPTVLLTVPLILEKIYRNSVVPTIRKSKILSWMNKHQNKLMCLIIGMKFKKTFGRRLGIGVGGAKLDPTVEEFFYKARFVYAVGYGLTETASLICYALGKNRRPGSIGIPLYGVKMRLDNINPKTGEGEIVVKGDCVMPGYYKDPERTKEVFTEDGWFKTNDIAYMDNMGRYYIKGRLGNMILGPSGENIYPEDIESLVNDIEGVNESLVVERKGKLVALIHFSEKMIDWGCEGEADFYEKLEAIKATVMDIVNQKLNRTSKINVVEVMKEPFDKTATRKIRRYKYEENFEDI
ncbi:MAG TPA: AMP-binding protein [Bacteroidales bacterium]|jgi:long-chain acyl-CoA synthetase|nr:AMP-binding protein [Bacteroidales bacterium]HPB88847.1 AMP-binding protein [Bacteroidales bacterium]HPY22398.1 AMP-binding protein [Bacteroidales bacterium]HQA93078.1 AMP-binding protein [Bacteroidales bacterium]HQN23752.1 AMP-binding protein [Bacteroidales bacterium]